MSLYAFLLVVLAAFVHTSWNLLAKRSASVGPALVFGYTIMSGVVYAPWVAWVLWRDGLDWSLPIAACIAASSVLHLAYSLCLQRGYRVADLSVVYPVARGSAPALSSAGAFLLLAERPSLQGLAGLGLVIGGIALMAAASAGSGRVHAVGRGILWGLATGGLIAIYSVVDAWGVKVLLIAPVVLDWFANSARIVMISPWLLRDRQVWQAMRGHWGTATAIGALAPLSYILILTALQSGAPLSVVAPSRELSMMLAALAGALILREPVGRWRLAGCALLATGVGLLSTA